MGVFYVFYFFDDFIKKTWLQFVKIRFEAFMHSENLDEESRREMLSNFVLVWNSQASANSFSEVPDVSQEGSLKFTRRMLMKQIEVTCSHSSLKRAQCMLLFYYL